MPIMRAGPATFDEAPGWERAGYLRERERLVLLRWAVLLSVRSVISRSTCARVGVATLLVLGVLPAGVGARTRSGGAKRLPSPGLAATPYMGWNTYYGVGTHYNQATIASVVDALVGRGFRRAGYRYVWLTLVGGQVPVTRGVRSLLTPGSGRGG